MGMTLRIGIGIGSGGGAEPEASAPDLTVTIIGTGVEGTVHSLSVSGRGYPPADLSYAWTLDATPNGATGATYTPDGDDVGGELNCTVSAADNGSGSDSAAAASGITITAASSDYVVTDYVATDYVEAA